MGRIGGEFLQGAMNVMHPSGCSALPKCSQQNLDLKQQSASDQYLDVKNLADS